LQFALERYQAQTLEALDNCDDIGLPQRQPVGQAIARLAHALCADLANELHIPEEQVKVATGTQRELDGLNLSAHGPVRYIITMQALRESCDCAFAYVACSVQSVLSATAIEQLLGRVLRMPMPACARARRWSRPFAQP